ncbi:MAG: hypothetical protein AAF822_06455 [Pseudomonadota bacterium]
MRATLFAVGLSLAGNIALAQAQDTTDDRITLTNGCVYAQGAQTTDNAWSLIYTQAGTTVECALTIYGQTAAIPAAADATPLQTVTQDAPVYRDRPRIVLSQNYLVGVFR